jgi:hypothetical protein
MQKMIKIFPVKTLYSILFSAMIIFIFSCKSETPTEKTREEQIAEMIEGMKKNPEWMQALQQKAIDWKKPLDSVMYIDAVWMIDQQPK